MDNDLIFDKYNEILKIGRERKEWLKEELDKRKFVFETAIDSKKFNSELNYIAIIILNDVVKFKNFVYKADWEGGSLRLNGERLEYREFKHKLWREVDILDDNGNSLVLSMMPMEFRNMVLEIDSAIKKINAEYRDKYTPKDQHTYSYSSYYNNKYTIISKEFPVDSFMWIEDSNGFLKKVLISKIGLSCTKEGHREREIKVELEPYYKVIDGNRLEDIKIFDNSFIFHNDVFYDKTKEIIEYIAETVKQHNLDFKKKEEEVYNIIGKYNYLQILLGRRI